MNALFNKIYQKALNQVTKAALKISQKSPTIMLVGGIALVVTGTGMAISATSKASDCMDEFNERMNRIKESSEIADSKEDPEEAYPVAQRKEDTRIVYGHMIMSMAKIYLPSILVEAAGIALICKSHQVLSRRNAGLAAAYAAMSKSFNDYRKRVRDKYGEEEENNLYYGYETKALTVSETGDNGVTTEVVKEVRKASPIDPYSRFIDETTNVWDKTPQYTLQNLIVQQRMLNARLWNKGFVTLNDAYDALGIPRTKEGMVIGWVKDPNNETKISFGLDDLSCEATRRFINGLEQYFLATFNVDGNIYDMHHVTKEENGQVA